MQRAPLRRVGANRNPGLSVAITDRVYVPVASRVKPLKLPIRLALLGVALRPFRASPFANPHLPMPQRARRSALGPCGQPTYRYT